MNPFAALVRAERRKAKPATVKRTAKPPAKSAVNKGKR